MSIAPPNDNNDEMARLYRIRKTAVQMLGDRGFVCERELTEMALKEFMDTYGGEEDVRSAIQILAPHQDEDKAAIMVFFAKSAEAKKKIGIKELKVFCDKMDGYKVKHCIIVVNNDVTPFARKALQALKSKDEYYIEIFLEASLLVNITEHVLVPKHKLLSDEEKADLLKRYKLETSQLPVIRPDDPVARYYGLKVGQVVKIVRPSETAGKYVTYRYVSKAV